MECLEVALVLLELVTAKHNYWNNGDEECLLLAEKMKRKLWLEDP